MWAAVAIRAHAYPVLWRIIVAVLLAVSGASLPATLVAVVFASDPPITPFVLIRLVLVFALLPWLVAWLIQRALAIDIEISGAQLLLRRRGLGRCSSLAIGTCGPCDPYSRARERETRPTLLTCRRHCVKSTRALRAAAVMISAAFPFA